MIGLNNTVIQHLTVDMLVLFWNHNWPEMTSKGGLFPHHSPGQTFHHTPPDAWRWAFSLKKMDSIAMGEKVIQEVIQKFPNDKFVISEFGWIQYFKDINPGLGENNLGRIINAANKVWTYNPTDLLLAKLVLAVTKAAGKRGKWDIVLEWSRRVKADLVRFEGN